MGPVTAGTPACCAKVYGSGARVPSEKTGYRYAAGEEGATDAGKPNTRSKAQVKTTA